MFYLTETSEWLIQQLPKEPLNKLWGIEGEQKFSLTNITQGTRYAHGAGSTQGTRYAHGAGSTQSTRCAHGAGSTQSTRCAHGAGSTQSTRCAHGAGSKCFRKEEAKYFSHQIRTDGWLKRLPNGFYWRQCAGAVH
mgnify:CR=1 FL=1